MEPSVPGQFQDRWYIVFGASGELGLATVTGLLDRGANVLAVSSTAESSARILAGLAESNDRLHLRVCDVRSHEEVSLLAEEVVKDRVSLDGLVFCSGVSGPSSWFWNVSPEDWAATMAVNQSGAFYACKYFHPLLQSDQSQSTSSIVLVGSSARVGPMPGKSAYAASKAGLHGLMLGMAADYGASGPRVNMVEPGPIAGPRLSGSLERLAEFRGLSIEEMKRDLFAKSYGREPCTVSEVAHSVLYLLSDESRPVHGSVLRVG